ncbi:MAG: flippase-like domain-containing protein [Ardenticatenaceae bacterium]|nr:flippase-like domain-containing protein [Ardenticatenaceae bacterium]
MRSKITFRRITYILLLAAFGYALYTYQGQLVDILNVLQQGVWYLILAAISVLGLAVYNQGLLYASIYKALNLPPPKERHLSYLYLITRFVSVAAPSGGVSGVVPFIQEARRRNVSVGPVLIVNLIYLILWYSTMGVFLFIGLLHLFLIHDLQWFEISNAIILLLADSALIGGLAIAWTSPHRLEAILNWIGQLTGRVAGWWKRPSPLPPQRTATFIKELDEAINEIRQVGYQSLSKPILHAFLNEILNLGILFFVAWSFGIKLSFGVLVASYSVGMLFFVMTPTPGGLGFVEGILILVMSSLDVPDESALVITLAYRGLTFWLPFILGFFAYRWFNRHLNKLDAEDEPPESLNPNGNGVISRSCTGIVAQPKQPDPVAEE